MSCFLKLYYVRTLQGFVAVLVLRLPSVSRIDYVNIHLCAGMIGTVPARFPEICISSFALSLYTICIIQVRIFCSLKVMCVSSKW